MCPIALVGGKFDGPVPCDRFDEVDLVGGPLVRADLADLLAHRGQERVLQLTSQVQQACVPFPARGDSAKPRGWGS